MQATDERLLIFGRIGRQGDHLLRAGRLKRSQAVPEAASLLAATAGAGNLIPTLRYVGSGLAG